MAFRWPEQILHRGVIGGWTAPRWLTVGGILCFYHIKKAQQRITALLKSANTDDAAWQELPDPHGAFERLMDQFEIASEFAGPSSGALG